MTYERSIFDKVDTSRRQDACWLVNHKWTLALLDLTAKLDHDILTWGLPLMRLAYPLRWFPIIQGRNTVVG
jgi:hypothetical protein